MSSFISMSACCSVPERCIFSLCSDRCQPAVTLETFIEVATKHNNLTTSRSCTGQKLYKALFINLNGFKKLTACNGRCYNIGLPCHVA